MALKAREYRNYVTRCSCKNLSQQLILTSYNVILDILKEELIFFHLTIYCGVNSDLAQWSAEFNKMPHGIHMIFFFRGGGTIVPGHQLQSIYCVLYFLYFLLFCKLPLHIFGNITCISCTFTDIQLSWHTAEMCHLLHYMTVWMSPSL